ncbi:MAG: GAF domain-containing protein [Chloroflexota bacterium]
MLIPLGVCLALAAALWPISAWVRGRLLDNQRFSIENAVSAYSGSLTAIVNQRLALIAGVTSFVYSHPDDRQMTELFPEYAGHLYASQGGIRTIQVFPPQGAELVYPVAGNEVVSTRTLNDLLIDARPQVQADLQRAISTRAPTLSEPYQLRQGGMGLVIRQAIFRDDKLWGFTVVVLDVPDLWKDAGLLAEQINLRVAVRHAGSGQILFGAPEVFAESPVLRPIALPDGNWEIAAVPQAGWGPSIAVEWGVYLAVSVAFVLLLTFIAYRVTAFEMRLREIVAQKTASLSQELIHNEAANKQILKLNRIYSVLSATNEAIIRVRDLTELYQSTCQIAIEKGGYELAWIGLISPASQALYPIARAAKDPANLAVIEYCLGDGPTSACPLRIALHSPGLMVCRGDTPGCRLHSLAPGIVSLASFPLMVKEENRGVISFGAAHLEQFGAEELQLIRELARNISYAIEFSEQEEQRKWFEAEVIQLNRLYRMLSQVNERVLRTASRTELLETVCRIAVEQGSFRLAWVAWVDREAGCLRLAAQAGDDSGRLNTLVIPLQDPNGTYGPLVTVVQTGAPFFSLDFDHTIWKEAAEQIGFKAMGSFPIRLNGEICGTLNVHVENNNFFRMKEINVLQEVADDLSFALEYQLQESLRLEAEAAITHSEHRYRASQQAGHIGSWEWDVSLDCLSWSEEMYAIFDKDPDAFTPSNSAVFDAMLPEDRPLAAAAVDAALQQHTPFFVEYRILDRHANQKWIESKGELAFNAEGLPTMAVGTVQDITRRKQAEEALRRLNLELEQRVADRTRQLEESNRELEAFAYSVSHDLRAPLRAIEGFSSMLQEDYAAQLDQEGGRLIEVIRANTGKLDKLITDLLALSRVSRAELQVSPIDMTGMAYSIYHEVATPEVSAKFTFQVNPLPMTAGDPTLMRQVWTNLISNAIKYTLPKSERRIEISGYEQAGQCIYLVKDSGVGYNPKFAAKLFGLFQRLHKSQDFEGTGVGLAIVKRIIERHEGRIWAESTPGEGAVFYFSLPTRTA